MTRLSMVAAVTVCTALLGCGEIVEVPVATSGETGQTEGTGGSDPTGADPTGRDTDRPDVDSESASGTADDGASSSGAPPPELHQFCLELGDSLRIAEDGSWTTASVEVSPPGGVIELQVSLRVSHPRISDLRVVLRAPDDGTITLLDEPACAGANIDATFQDGADALGNEQCLAADVAAVKGPVKALDELHALLGESVDGPWTIELTDTVPGELGDLDQACVVLTAEGG